MTALSLRIGSYVDQICRVGGELCSMVVKGMFLLMAMVYFAVGLEGCGGGGAELKSHTTTTTVGQELMDLESAYEKGVITEKEYNGAKKKILERK